MQETKIWILGCAVLVMGTILSFIIKVAVDQVIKRLDQVVLELKQLAQSTMLNTEQIRSLQDRENQIQVRLNNHAERLRNLEINSSNPNHIDT